MEIFGGHDFDLPKMELFQGRDAPVGRLDDLSKNLSRQFLQTQVLRAAVSGIWASSSSGNTTSSHQHAVAAAFTARAQWFGSPHNGHSAVSGALLLDDSFVIDHLSPTAI
jgi:hypothetical protein